MLTERCSKISLSGSRKEMAVGLSKQHSSDRCIKTLTTEVEHENPDMLQLDIAMFVRQSEHEAQSGKAHGLSTDDMVCGRSCAVKPDCVIIEDVSWAEAGLPGNINVTTAKAHTADFVIRLITLHL